MAPTTRSTPRAGRRTTPKTSRMPARPGRASGTKRKQQQQGIGGMLAGLLPGRAATKATPSSKRGKAGGAAFLAAAAGMAFRNRDKLSAMLNRKRSGTAEQETPATSPAPRPEQSASRPGV